MLRLGKQGSETGDAIVFTKLAGGGNDFIVIDNRQKIVHEGAELARKVCTRRLSIGADGLILIETSAKARFRMIYFNGDGSRAFCANGTRCAARFALMNIIAPRKMTIETDGGVIPAEVLDHGEVALTLPPPREFRRVSLATGTSGEVEGSYVVVGVPHFIIPVTGNLWATDIDGPGREIRAHADLGPEGANVDFVKVENRTSIALRTWERGVEGETLSCGSGVVAAVAVAALGDEVDSPVSVMTRSGIGYSVEYERSASGTELVSMSLCGDARVVFKSQFTTDTLSGFDDEWVRNPTDSSQGT